MHPLIHENTSTLSEQRFSSTFTGEELFLEDHQVNGQKFLPAVAYLEMARAALQQATPTQQESIILELYNTVWAQPIVVTQSKQVTIALLANYNEQIDYEIYSHDKDQGIVHCQGQAVFSKSSGPTKLDIQQLKEQMGKGRLEAASLYNAFTKMGIRYGPSHQGLTVIYQGDQELLAEISLPAAVENTHKDYQLHPSLLDSALQASIGLIADMNQLPKKPSIPFALEALSIVSGCTKEMVAWVRYSHGSKPEDQVIKLDIDLCDVRRECLCADEGIFLQGANCRH